MSAAHGVELTHPTHCRLTGRSKPDIETACALRSSTIEPVRPREAKARSLRFDLNRRLLPGRQLEGIVVALPVDKSASNHSAIENDPAHARQVDVLVTLQQAEPEPQDR